VVRSPSARRKGPFSKSKYFGIWNRCSSDSETLVSVFNLFRWTEPDGRHVKRALRF
jgi:hypothetical protein